MTALVLLGALAAQAVDEELRAALRGLASEFLDERVAALKVLGGAGNRAEAVLIEGLGAADASVRLHAIRLLEKIGSRRPIEQVGRIFREASAPELREAAFAFLKKFPEQAEPYLIPALEHELVRVRKEALEALRKAPGARAVGAVARLYAGEADAALKEEAFKYLVAAGAAAEPELVRLLAAPDPAVRQKVLEGLKNSTSEAAIRAVGELFLKEPDAKVLGAAKEFLDRRYAQAGGLSERYLVRALEEGTGPAKKLAVDLLHAQKSEAGAAAAGRLLVGAREKALIESLARYLEPQASAAPFLHEAARSGAPEAAAAALEMLERRRDFGSVAAASDRARPATVEGLRLAAVSYLAASGAQAAEAALVAALEDRLPAIRSRAIEGLGALQTPAAIGALARRLRDVEPQDRERITAALGRFKAEALRAILASGDAAAIPEETRERIRELHARVAVEEHLDGALARTAGGAGAGTYEGQFAALKEPPLEVKRVEALLLEMIGPEYRPVREGAGRGPGHRRALAALALAELSGEWAVDRLWAQWEAELGRGAGLSRVEMRAAFAVALARAGRKEAAETLAAELGKFAEAQRASGAPAAKVLALEADCWRALVWARTGRLDEAARGYEAVLAGAEGAGGAFKAVDAVRYNLACVRARQGRSAEALAALKAAVEAGFADRAWIERDADLTGLRALPEFRKIVEGLPAPP